MSAMGHKQTFAWRWGVAAERKPLEMVARPLTFVDID